MIQDEPREAQTKSMLDGLVWGIRDSFLTYVKGSRGTIVVEHGAGTLGEEGPFHFPVDDVSDFDLESHTGTLVFRGTVLLGAHFGLLKVEVTDPWLTFEAEGGAFLSVAVSGGGRRILATVQMDTPEVVGVQGESVLAWPAMPAALHDRAISVFNDVYQPGEALDDLHVRIAKTRFAVSPSSDQGTPGNV